MENILNNNLIKYNIKNTIRPSMTVIINENEVMKKHLKEFTSFGKGFIVFEYSNGSKEVYVDSFSDKDHLGYIINNKKMVEQLTETYNTILKAVKEGKLKLYKINN